MIVFNTTFHVDAAAHEEFVAYMLRVFLPTAVSSGDLTSPRLSRIFSDRGKEEEMGFSYAMEFKVADSDTLEKWMKKERVKVITPLMEKFREKVVGFSTMMEIIYY